MKSLRSGNLLSHLVEMHLGKNRSAVHALSLVVDRLIEKEKPEAECCHMPFV